MRDSGGLRSARIAHFISADWSKHSNRRSVWSAEKPTRRISRQEPSFPDLWNLGSLLGLAERLSEDGPVLIGVDVVLGVPTGFWQLIQDSNSKPPNNFIDWLAGLADSSEFFATTATAPEQWSVFRPWFEVMKGPGGLKSFTRKVPHGMHRKLEVKTRANPLFAVSGIPGTVGSGTREFWRELAPRLSGDRQFAVWPFDGEMNSLLTDFGVVLCETYPALAYSVALSDHLPARRQRTAKTQSRWRQDQCDQLLQAAWAQDNDVDLGPLGRARENEDDLDACFTAAAVLRLLIEGRQLAHPDWIDGRIEGSMLLTGAGIL